MKKIAFLFFALFSSVCSFAGHVKVFSWSSNGSTSNVVTFVGVAASDFAVPFYNNTFGLVLRGSNAQAVLQVPSLSSSVVTNRYSNIDHPVSFDDSASVGNATVWHSVSSSPDLLRLFTFARSVVVSGYSGNGLVCVDPSTFNRKYNFDYKVVVGELLCSTNNIYRSLVLSHLSQLATTVSNIDSSLVSIHSLLGSMSFTSPSDPFVSDFPAALSNAFSLGYVDQFSLDAVLSSYNGLDSVGRDIFARAYSRGFSNYLSLDNLNSSLSAHSALSSLGSSFNSGIRDILNGGSSGGSGGIAGDIKRLSTNDWASVVTNQLAQGTRDAKRQLQDNHDSITNRLAHMFDDTPNSAGRAIRHTADNTAVSAARASDIASKLNGVLHVQVDNPNNIGVVLDGPVTFDTTQFNGVSVPLAGVKDKIDTWYDDWYSFWDISNSAVSWANFYNMLSDFKTLNHSDLSAITNSLRGVFSVTGDVSRIYDYLSGPQSNLLEVIASSITNNWDNYYFKRFRRANEFYDEDDQPFTLEGASDTVFGRGFDEGEYSKLNWFSRVELLLFQLSAVSSATNALESVDIEDDLNDTVDSFNQHGQDFVNASRRVVGLFQLIDGFAASMRAAFGDYSNPVTRGIVLLPAGSWIGDNALVLEVSVTIQNALRLVFQCIWYLSAFVVAWRVVATTWSRVVSFVRWLWSVFDI